MDSCHDHDVSCTTATQLSPAGTSTVRSRPRPSSGLAALCTMSHSGGSANRSRGRRKVLMDTNVAVVLSLGVATFFGWAAQPTSAATDSISIAPPGTLTAGEDFTVEWTYTTEDEVRSERTTGDLYPFEIDLRTCGDDGVECENGSCGNATTHNLCEDRGAAGSGVCMDSDGSVKVSLPAATSAGDYVLRVTYKGPSSSAATSSTESGESSGTSACSNPFTIKEPEVALGTPVLAATAPEKELFPGQAFTAQWAYDNGEGSSEGLFDVNLYSCADGACAEGSCGTFTQSLCGTEGCYDPGTGDYDVRIPDSITPGSFKLEVTTNDMDSCTDSAFEVVRDPSATPSPAVNPTKAPKTPTPTTSPTGSPVAPETGAPSPAPVVAKRTPAPTAKSLVGTPGSPGYPPTDTPVPERITCNSAAVLKYSYKVESNGLGVITISHESGDATENGCANFTSLWEWLLTLPTGVPTDALYPVDPTTNLPDTGATAVPTGIWLLRISVDSTNGVLFEVKGTNVKGDCDELQISSDGTNYFRLRGAGGHLYFYQTKVQSWNEDTGSVLSFELDSDGSTPRSYVGCLSEIVEAGQTCVGRAKSDRGACRMDIIESEMGYLGFYETEAYGISWKVRGLCEDLSNVDTIFENIRVYGDLQDSDIHHMWYGMYSYGHLGGVWTNNLMHDNHVYGFDPHDDSDYLTIEGNTAYNNGNHGIIASKRCDHLLVKDNVSYDNGGSGIMLHQSCDDSIVTGNDLYDNYDAGLSLVETSRTIVTNNKCNTNKYGMRVLVGCLDNEIERNSFDSNTQHDVVLYLGSEEDVPLVAPYTGINVGNIINDNAFTVATKLTVDIEDSEETSLTNNVFDGTSGKFSFIRSTETRVSGNTGVAANAVPDVEDSCFTTDSDIGPVC